MNKKSLLHMLAIACAVCLVTLGMPAPAAAQSECSSSAGTQYTDALDGGLYTFQMDEYDSSLQECVDISGVGFSITTASFSNATNGEPAAYTSIYRGCHWGSCTTSNPFPIEESNIASASTSVSITQPSGSANDAAYDIWFNQTSTTSGQPNGTEVMIWLNHQGSIQPFGSQVATATIGGTSWNVWTGNQSSWKIISYVAATPVTSASLNLLPFFADAVSRGSLESTWWLIDVEYGFEIWTGGEGLAMSGFSVSAAAGSSGGGGTCGAVPSAPSGLTATTSSSSVINLAWTADTAPANCTISSYNVFRSTTSGFTPSSSNQIASGVTATSYSSTGLTASTTYYYKIEAVDADGTSAASAQASATTSASSGGGGGGSSSCTVDYTIGNQWQGGFGAAITIKNTGNTALTSWTLTWAFANGQTISQFWNGVETQSGANVTVKNESYNGSIAADGSLTGLGFNGTWNNSTNAVPTAISLNGTACTVN